MRTRELRIVLASMVMLAAILACTGLAAAPSVSNIRMTKDQAGKTPTTTYAPGDAFYAYADVSGLSKGSVVEARWYALNAQGLSPNTALNTSTYTYESGVATVYFQLTTGDGSDWPTGTYMVELYLDGTKVGEQNFTVQ